MVGDGVGERDMSGVGVCVLISLRLVGRDDRVLKVWEMDREEVGLGAVDEGVGDGLRE